MAQASLSSLSDFQVILVPGLHDSSFEHWQSRWQRAHPDFWRVRQDDWHTPDLRAWAAGLDQVRALDKRPALLVAHSFGCLVALYSITHDARAVAGALLVAPADPDKFGVAGMLPSSPVDFPTILISSSNDPWMRAGQAARWARRWGSTLIEAGALGHINADSGLGDWPFGQKQLQLLYDCAHNRQLALTI